MKPKVLRGVRFGGLKKGYQQTQPIKYSTKTRPKASGLKVSPPDFRADARHVENAAKKTFNFLSGAASRAVTGLVTPGAHRKLKRITRSR